MATLSIMALGKMAEHCYAECHFTLSVTYKHSMLTVVMVSVVMVGVVAPLPEVKITVSSS